MLSVGPREIAAAVRVLAKGDLGRYSAGGSSVTKKFEREIADATGVQHALAVNSGTSALICALVAAGIGPGDEVLVPSYTWVSTAAAPLAVGAVPVLVDVDESATIDPLDIRRKITPHTRAIIPVHMINLVCDMDAIMAIAAEHDLVVIEDACQAIGVRHRGRRVGSIGHLGAFSFNQMKNLRCGEGGVVLTDNNDWHTRAEMFHDVGHYERADRAATDVPLIVGQNLRMPELSAAVLRPQVRRLDRQLTKRRAMREILIEAVDASTFDAKVSPHHAPDEAVGVAFTFTDPDEATRFGAAKGARRLIDSGRHVFTNWQSVVSKRPVDPRRDPHQWAHREIRYDEEWCPATLPILATTCTVEIAPEIPLRVFKTMVKRMTT